MEIHTHYRNKPIKQAKCGKYSLIHCQKNYKECDDCRVCTLVRHMYYKVYMVVNGKTYKRCPHCCEYKPLTAFSPRRNNTRASWCIKCTNLHNKLKRYETKSI